MTPFLPRDEVGHNMHMFDEEPEDLEAGAT